MTSTALSASAPVGAIEQRLARLHIQPVTAVAIVAALIVLVGDSQSLTLIPLVTPMEKDYSLTAPQATLVLSILAIVGAGAVPVLTRIAERISLRWFLIIGLTISTLGNALCAIAPGFTLLVIGRILLGLSAAGPISIALMREKSKDAHGTNRGMGLVTAAIGLGVAISFLMGGTILLLNGTVHTVFWVMTALAFISLIGAWILVPDHKLQVTARIDYVGAVLLIVGLTAIAIAVSYGSGWGWTSGATLGTLAAGVVIMAIWVWIELSVKHPMIDLRRTFKRSTVPAYFSVGLYGGLAILSNLAVTNYAEFAPVAKVPGLNYGYGDIVLVAALFLMPTAFFVLFGGFIAGPIITKLGVKATLLLGGALVIVGFAFLALWHTEVWQNALGMGIWGFAFSLGYTAANAAYLHAAKDSEASLFSAAGTMVYGAVGSFGAPVFTAVLLATVVVLPLPTGGTAEVPTAQSYTNEWWVAALGGLILLLLAFVHKKVEYQGNTEDIVLEPNEISGMPTEEVLLRGEAES